MFLSALKYLRSNLGHQQGDLQCKIKKKEKTQKPHFRWFFMLGVGFLVPTLPISSGSFNHSFNYELII